MSHNITIDKPIYFIAHNNADIVHYGYSDAIGSQISTGQPELEVFDDEELYLARLLELGVEPEPKDEEAFKEQ